MNKRRMLQLARELEEPKKLPIQFNMSDFIQGPHWCHQDTVTFALKVDCGTTACIAGTACLMFGKDGSFIGEGQAMKLLGLTQDQAERLFYNQDHYIAKFTDFNKINREQAALAVRRMVREEGGE